MKSRTKKLAEALCFLKEGEGIKLEDDTFLCTGGLDGSDKIYGFAKKDNELQVISRQASDGYPIEDMDKDDLKYIFGTSKTSIINKVLGKEYKVVQVKEI